jgi:hypothetical protein
MYPQCTDFAPPDRRDHFLDEVFAVCAFQTLTQAFLDIGHIVIAVFCVTDRCAVRGLTRTRAASWQREMMYLLAKLAVALDEHSISRSS